MVSHLIKILRYLTGSPKLFEKAERRLGKRKGRLTDQGGISAQDADVEV